MSKNSIKGQCTQAMKNYSEMAVINFYITLVSSVHLSHLYALLNYVAT